MSETLDCGLFGITLNVGLQLIYTNKVQYQAQAHLNYKHLAGDK